MLTIHPNFTNNVSRTPAFGRSDLQKYAEDVDYMNFDNNDDYYEGDIKHRKNYFDINEEKAEAKKELDLWEQTKANVDQIAQKTDMVPGLKTGTKVLSGLTAVAIGWGGLRWGTVGTLEVLSKIGKTDFMQSIGRGLNTSRKYVSKKYSDLGSYISGRKWYQSAGERIKGWEKSFLDIILIAGSVGWLYYYNYQQNVLVEQGVTDTTAAVNPIMFIASTAFILGAGLLCVRIYPLIIKLIYNLGKRF